MRIHVKTTPAKGLIGFNHLHLMSGTLHKWIGENNFHDDISLYSFSKLSGGKATKKGLSFSEGADFFISCWDNDLAKCIVAGIQQDTDMFSGLKVVEIVLQENPDLSSRGKFNIASPIFIQRNIEEGRKKFYFYDDEESSELMTETLHHKMKVAGLPYDESLTISFNQSYPRKGTKLLSYKKGDSSIQLRASWCPVIIQGEPETKAFAWNVGIGNSTGIGFGAIK